MVQELFSLSGHAEVWTRSLLSQFPKLKESIKTRYKRGMVTEKKVFDEARWIAYSEYISSVIKDNEILLIHSSVDGLNEIGVTADILLDFLLKFRSRNCTIVLPAYAIGSAKINNGRLKTYDPQKSPCWTGMLPNYFLRQPGVVRTVYPYNSLAAIGPHTRQMMSDNEDQVYVYGDHSAWKYCVENHAKVLFIGTTSDNANTIQSHMIADVMKEEWPISDWYQEVICPVKIEGSIHDKTIKVQKDEWSKYVADYHITRKLKKSKLLMEYKIEGCPFGYVEDSKEMVDFLIALAKNGDLSYIVPRKYRRIVKSEY